ncbi:MAG: hypothetical protein ACLQDL_05650 [Spirochaetia bacterium]
MRIPFWRDFAIWLAVTALAGVSAFASAEIGAPAAYGVPPENWEARSRLSDTIFAPIHEAAAAGRQIIAQSAGAATVRFQLDEQSGALYFVFANRTGADYPVDGAGTFIIKRSLRDGSFLQAKIFVQDGPGTYLRLFPQGERTFMDVYLFGEPFQTRIALPVSFDRLLTSPLSSIVEWSAAVVNWPLVLAPPPGLADRRIMEMVRVLTSRLPGLRDMDDGAMDGAGRMVYIASGASAGRGGFNCSGFAKWVVDSLYAPLAGKMMDIAPLKSRDAARSNAWSARFEEELDPYFGLDWSRGLARTVAEAQTGIAPTDAQIDVRDSDHVPYVKDVGYPVPKLQYLLYLLSRGEPGFFYVGSVNAPSRLAVSEGTPTLRQHHHVVVLFPYVDADGVFQVAVMERNKRTSLASLTRRYGAEYIHLVRIDSAGPFEPPRIE